MQFLLRICLLGFSVFMGLIGLVQATSYDAMYFDALRDYFVASECEGATRCFMGVYTEQDVYAARDHLEAHPHVASVDIVDIHMRLHHVDVEWSGAQPAFLHEKGVISLVDDTVSMFNLTPDLSLGEMWHAFGAPQAISGNFANVLLRYPEAGLIVGIRPDCDHFWESTVLVRYTSEIEGNAENAHTIIDILRESC